MADKPSYRSARKARGTADMTIEPMPKTTFTDKNLDPRMEPADPEKITGDNAKSGGSISLMPNAPKQAIHASGSNHPDAEGLTKI